MRPVQGIQGGGFGLPPLTPSVRSLLIGLFALYVLELAARNVLGLPVDALAWFGRLDPNSAPWQPLTRFLVQGNDVLNVVFGGLAWYFFLPPVEADRSTRQIAESIAAAAIGGTVLAGAIDLVFGLGGVAHGWLPLTLAPLVLFSLARPDAQIRLMFVLPVPAQVFAWGSGALALLGLLASPGMGSADWFGAWLGVVGWWYLRGPGSRRLRLLRQKRKVERDLRRFEVIEGGKKPLTKGPFDDDVVH